MDYYSSNELQLWSQDIDICSVSEEKKVLLYIRFQVITLTLKKSVNYYDLNSEHFFSTNPLSTFTSAEKHVLIQTSHQTIGCEICMKIQKSLCFHTTRIGALFMLHPVILQSLHSKAPNCTTVFNSGIFRDYYIILWKSSHLKSVLVPFPKLRGSSRSSPG